MKRANNKNNINPQYNAIIQFQLVSRPQQFDVMLMPNLYGSIITNISAGLVGGAGLVSGVNIGDNFAVFETVIFI